MTTLPVAEGNPGCPDNVFEPSGAVRALILSEIEGLGSCFGSVLEATLGSPKIGRNRRELLWDSLRKP